MASRNRKLKELSAPARTPYMYLNFYGLKEQPFGVTPDARYLYLSNTHREALASLFYGLETGRGFMAMIAKPGMGKTTLLGHILKKFQRSARTAFLFNTQCNSREFLEALASELGFECRSANLVQFLDDFNRNLVREAKQRRRCIVVIDEAQNLDASVLETARLLSNFETPRAKLLQIILAGQPELAHKLGSPALSQLRQRISMFNRLEPFTTEDTGRYIYHRLNLAGYNGSDLFPSDTISAIASYAEGIPRSINNLCFAALSLGCATKRQTIDVSMVKEVVADLDVSRLGPRLEPVSVPHRMRSTDISDSTATPVFPFVQSPMTFGRLLRKIDLTDADESAETEEALPVEEDAVVPDSTAKWPQVIRK
jgi:general secretion pathway protein A